MICSEFNDSCILKLHTAQESKSRLSATKENSSETHRQSSAFKSCHGKPNFQDNQIIELRMLNRLKSFDYKDGSNNTSYECLMSIEGCNQNFSTLTDMCSHLIHNCPYFLCRNCADNQKPRAPMPYGPLSESSENPKCFITFDIDPLPSNNNVAEKCNIAIIQAAPATPKPFSLRDLSEFSKLTIDNCISIFILQVKQASFFDSRDQIVCHNQNLYSNIISYQDVVYEAIKSSKSCFINSQFCVKNFENIPQDEFESSPTRRQEKLKSLLNEMSQAKTFAENESNLYNSCRATRIINNKTMACQTSMTDKAENTSLPSNFNISEIQMDSGGESEIFSNSRHRASQSMDYNKSIKTDKPINIKSNFQSRLFKLDNFGYKMTTLTKLTKIDQSKIKFRVITHSSNKFKVKQEYDCGSPILCINIIPFANIAITGSEDSSISIFNLSQKSNRRFSSFKHSARSIEHSDEIRNIQPFPQANGAINTTSNCSNEEHIFISTDKKGSLIVWKIDVGKRSDQTDEADISLKVVEKHLKLVPSARSLVITNFTEKSAFNYFDKNQSSKTKYIIIFGMSNGDLIYFHYSFKLVKESKRYISNHRSPVTNFSYFDNLSLLVSASVDGKLTIWSLSKKQSIDLNDDQLECTYDARLIGLERVSTDQLCVLYDDNCLKFFSLKTYRYVAILSHIAKPCKSKMISISRLEEKLSENNSIVVGYDNKELIVYSLNFIKDCFSSCKFNNYYIP